LSSIYNNCADADCEPFVLRGVGWEYIMLISFKLNALRVARVLRHQKLILARDEQTTRQECFSNEGSPGPFISAGRLLGRIPYAIGTSADQKLDWSITKKTLTYTGDRDAFHKGGALAVVLKVFNVSSADQVPFHTVDKYVRGDKKLKWWETERSHLRTRVMAGTLTPLEFANHINTVLDPKDPKHLDLIKEAYKAFDEKGHRPSPAPYTHEYTLWYAGASASEIIHGEGMYRIRSIIAYHSS
jgi:hypothetical protein